MPNVTALAARVLRPHFFHSLAVVALVAACNTAPGATAVPSAQPESSQPPTGAPTDSPTAAPTPTLAPSPTFGQGQIEHPTGATDIVLRMEQGGGFVPMEFFATQAPQFTLYGDGTVIFRSNSVQPAFGEPQPPFLTGKMPEENVQALLSYALSTGRLANAKPQYDNPMIADAPTTVFNLNAAGVEKVVSIYGLSEAMPGVPDQADRDGFMALLNLLMNFEDEAASGTVTDVAPYDAELYRVTMFENMGGVPDQEPIDWPWADLTLDDFPKGDEPGAIRMMTREEVAALTDVPNGGEMGIWVTAPDDTLVQFAVRPLLPDEQAAVESL